VRILAAGNANQNSIAGLDHVVVENGFADPCFELFLEFEDVVGDFHGWFDADCRVKTEASILTELGKLPRRQYISGTMTCTTHIPAPNPDAKVASDQLCELIRGEIEAGDGWISFARYMELALYAPGLGYYAGGSEKFGAVGDFVTAPELSPLFARALARQVAQIMKLSTSAILEFGAGSGRLAADLLSALAVRGEMPQRYDILELSAELRQRQTKTLAQQNCALNWLDHLPESFSGVVIANEVLDAMPVHLVAWRAKGIVERGVALDEKGYFTFSERPASGRLLAEAESIAKACALSPDYESEVALAAPAWLAAWGERFKLGALILIDYGFPRCEFYHPQRRRGSLMCHYHHWAHDDPFFLPGLQDITSHVDFTALMQAADAAGLELYGYTSQGCFLANCGLLDELNGLTPGSDEYQRAATAAHRLLSPQGMGESFKILVLGRGLEQALLGFCAGDRSYRL